jgi:hypothetical protein
MSRGKDLFGFPGAIPLLLPLSLFQRVDEPLIDQILSFLLEEGLQIAHVLRGLAERGRVIFLFDGLDEVGGPLPRRILAGLLQDLRRVFPACALIATSRIVGYQDAPLEGEVFEVVPLSDQGIQAFLVRWCELYEQEIQGRTAQAKQRGQQRGLRLGSDVLGHPPLLELVRTPLMLTVLALVDRNGLRLPEHRIELYEHAFRVLVERWNRVRGLGQTAEGTPVTLADALRLLGPVALRMIERDERILARGELESLLGEILTEKRLRGVRSVAEVIELFKTNLGLLVEQGPEIFAFLHLTIAEYLAAKELVRTRRLLLLARDKHKLFRPEWREVILLGAGELGFVRADDEALDELVMAVVRSSSKGARPTPRVPWLLAGFLADDPCLSERGADAIVDALIPGWWFEKRYTPRSLEEVASSALSFLEDRLRTSRFRERIHRSLRRSYAQGLPGGAARLWARSHGIFALTQICLLVGIDWGKHALQCLREMPAGSDIDVILRLEFSRENPGRVVAVATSRHLFRLPAASRPLCRMVCDDEERWEQSLWELEAVRETDTEVWLRLPPSWEARARWSFLSVSLSPGQWQQLGASGESEEDPGVAREDGG